MYLKSLELQGFKSFADKTKIELGGGIAAIVGPNGSGKSNVVEAIRWVLGEQSAKSLRGHKMQDVIFNGTKQRKPLGVAEISMVLDNSDRSLDLDFTEVRVTRRLYRSGEGEYLINGKNVRLKDIHQLFADSGIGSDGYAVIGQGRIAEIIDSKAEERRSIVEETAGIVKYRERKKEALRKIDHAEANLLRLLDIMTEIEGRLDPLEQESHAAEKYLEYTKERDTLAIGMLGETICDTREKLEKLDKEIADLTAEEEAHTASVMAKEARVAEKKAALSLENDRFHQREQEYHELKLHIERGEGELRSLDTLLSGFDEKQELLAAAIRDEAEKETAVENELAAAKATAEAGKVRMDELDKALTAMERRRRDEADDLRKAESEMESFRVRAFETARECGQKKNEGVSLRRQREGLEKRLAAIDEKYDRYDEEEAVLDRRIAAIDDRIDDLISEKDEVSAKERSVFEEIEAYAAKINGCKEKALELKMGISRGEARLKVLEELTLKREGFYPGVRAVLEQKGKSGGEGIYGVIAELIHVEKDYTLAMEAVLGSALQNIVTATGEDAASAVAYLKKERRGIATFLPLDLLRINERKTVPEGMRKDPAFVGNAADFVTAPKRVMPAVEYLLGNTLIFKDLNSAVALTRRYKGQFRIVTLEGDVINAGGTVSGGSREKSKNSFLQRQNEVEELRRFLLTAERKIAEWNKTAEEYGDSQRLAEKKGEQLRLKRNKLEEEIASFDSEINAIDTRRELFDREREGLDLERDQITEETESLSRRLEDVEKAVTEAEAEEKRLMDEIARREEAFRTAKASETEGRDEYTNLQVAFAEARTTYENDCATVERLEAEHAESKTAREGRQSEYDAAAGKRAISEERRERLKASLMAKNRSLLEFSESLEEDRAKKEALATEVTELENEAKAMAKADNDTREKLYQLSLRRERFAVETEQNEEQLREEYHMLLAEAIPYIDRERTKKDKRDRLKVLKRQIDALGTVNIGAIEEFKAVSERYAFLVGQRDDVLEAKASLEDIVGEMDAIIVKRFRATFDEINESFQKMFPAFFRGGQGELQLTDENDLLNTGVEIVVQPPGKRLQHLSLLSGGEKSLSGIALLFAILKVKPSPFYVLDEIDAALDDANVRRFADYLKEYGSDSQFMVITHRQGTMEAAETMYGVTMAEEGVSKTVSVKLL